MSASTPPNTAPHQTARQEALYRLQILDTPPHERFDRLIRLTARLLEMPVALISLSEGERQWFRSRYGLELPELPGELAPSLLAVESETKDVLVIEDARLDARLASNPLVQGEPYLRFYAAQPLISRDGQKIGALCVIDYQPRQFDEDARATLRDLAELVQSELSAVETGELLLKQTRIESQLRESEELFRTLADTAPVFIWMSGLEGENTFVSKGWLDYTGRQREQELGEGYAQSFHPEDIPRVWPVLLHGLENRQRFEFEVRLRRHDGVYRWMLAMGVPRYTDNGEFLGFVGSCVDIHDRKLSQELVARNERQYRTLAHHFPDGAVFLFDHDLRYLVADGQSLGVAGLSREQVEGHTLAEVLAPEAVVALEPLYRATLAGETFQGEIESLGHIFSMQFVPVRNDQGEVFAGLLVSQDITRQKKAAEALKKSTEELRQAQKMEAIGRLAGGVAHDFNNILTAITGCAEMGLMQLEPDHPVSADLNEILVSSRRAADLTAQLLTFSYRQVVQPRPLRLGEMVAGTRQLLDRLIGEDIELLSHYDTGEEDLVLADAGQLEQVIMNLALNARDSMPEGGRIIIDVEAVELDVPFSQPQQEIPAGKYMMLVVSDTGSGIDPANLPHIFEPFFTTKEVGKGTGLGLATVYGIVTQHHGYVTVFSQPGLGTTFKIFLPRYLTPLLPQSSAGPRDQVPAAASPVQPEASILVVEDDQSVRQVICRILAGQGYKVTEARQAGEALALCQTGNYNFELVLTDVIMPQMNGKELVRRLRQHQPALRVLYISGYSEGIITRRGVLEGDIKLLQKPFSSHDLLAMVGQMIEPGQAGSEG